MNYKLNEWENNGYHDSDFYGVYYDADAHEIHDVLIGSTRFAPSPCPVWQNAALPTPEIADRARQLLRDHIFARLTLADYNAVMTPDDAAKGDVLRLQEPHQRQLRASIPCERCGGDGFWRNPRNPEDRRKCFTCDGTGALAKGDVLKDPSGKVRRETLPAGSRIEVLLVTAFGRFYAKGYNHPNRGNRQVTGRLDTGAVVNIPLRKCRMDRDFLTKEEITERAERLSHEHFYASMFGGCAWLSANYAEGAAKAAKAAA